MRLANDVLNLAVWAWNLDQNAKRLLYIFDYELFIDGQEKDAYRSHF